MAQGLINNGVSITKDFSPNEYELLADYTVLDSAITSYTFSGLNINTDEEIVLEILIVNPTVSNTQIYLTVNNNITLTNYYEQYMLADNTGTGSARNNLPRITQANANKSIFANTNVKLTNNGYFVYQSKIVRELGTNITYITESMTTSTFTISQITSLTITSSVANAIGIGSRFQLYKVKGQVQQTWATT